MIVNASIVLVALMLRPFPAFTRWFRARIVSTRRFPMIVSSFAMAIIICITGFIGVRFVTSAMDIWHVDDRMILTDLGHRAMTLVDGERIRARFSERGIFVMRRAAPMDERSFTAFGGSSWPSAYQPYSSPYPDAMPHGNLDRSDY
jgi:hypothetical protein